MTSPAYRRAVDAGVVSLDIVLDALLAYCPSATTAGRAGATARRAVGDLKANAEFEIAAETIGNALQACFTAIYNTGMTFDQFERVRMRIMADEPVEYFAFAIKLAGLMLTFAMQCQRITTMTFNNRDDVTAIVRRMNKIVEELKMEAADALNSQAYQQLVQLAAMIMQHLAATEAQVPRIVFYDYTTSFSALALAHRIYQDADRFNELMDENKVIHPAFMPLRVRALSR